MGPHGDLELLKSFSSNIQDGHHISHLEILQTTSPPTILKVFQTVRKKKQNKKRLAVNSDASEDNSFDGSTTPQGYTARGKTHQGGYYMDAECIQICPLDVNGQPGTGQPVTSQPVSDQPVTGQPGTGLVNQAPINQSPVNQAPVIQK